MQLIVLILAATWASVMATIEDKYRVPIKVIFRAYCPACKWYISDPIVNLLEDDEFRAITDLTYLPAAAMTEDAGGLHCTGGEGECESQRWMACILDRYKGSVKDKAILMGCVESDESGYDWESKLEKCFPNPMDIAALKKCKKDLSTKLLREMMLVAQAHEGAWQPYTIIESTVLGDAHSAVTLSMLKTEICRRYSGPGAYLPKHCESISGVTKRVEATTAAPRTTTAPPPLTAPAEKVKLQVVWRAYCPACKWYLSDPLYDVLVDPAFQSIIDFQPYPSGSTKEVSTGQFTCAGGVSECTGHLYLSCALRLFPELNDVAENLKCLEDSHHTWDNRVSNCFSGLALEKIRGCYASDTSKQYLREYIAVSSTIAQSWVPYTLVNGKVLGSQTTGVGYEMLTKEICDAYRGTSRPSVCGPVALQNPEPTKAQQAQQPVSAAVATTKAVKEAATSNISNKPSALKSAKKDEKKPVMPCRQKEKGFVYDNPPGIGQRNLNGDNKPNVPTAAVVKLGSVPSSFSTNPLLLPMILIGGLLFAALRYSKPDKKKA